MRESRESKWMGAPASPPVVVLGAGFAGLRAVRRLGRAGVATLWVDARNYHCFLPLLYQVATAGLEPQDIAYPARSIPPPTDGRVPAGARRGRGPGGAAASHLERRAHPVRLPDRGD